MKSPEKQANAAASPQEPVRTIIQFFAAALGLAGLALAWLHAESAEVVPQTRLPAGLLMASLVVSVLVFVGYVRGAIDQRHEGGADIRTPATLISLASGSMTLMQLPAGLVTELPIFHSITSWLVGLWLAGVGVYAACAVLFGIAVLRIRPGLEAVTPAWFIPTVGMAVAPSAGVTLGFGPLATGMAFVGTIAWVALLPLVIWRLMLRSPLSPQQLPSLCVMIAPAALLSLALRTLEWGPGVATLFFYVSATFALLVAVMLFHRRSDIRGAGFSHGWWSATFPLAAMAGAAQLTFAASPTVGHLLAAQVTLGLATLVTTIFGIWTLRVIIARRST